MATCRWLSFCIPWFVIGSLLSIPLHGEDVVIAVDLPEKKVEPSNPTLNIRSSDTVLIDLRGQFTGKLADVNDWEIFSFMDLPTFERVAIEGKEKADLRRSYKIEEPIVSWGRQIIVSFRECNATSFSEEGIDPPADIPCSFAVKRGHSSWAVFTRARTLLFTVQIAARQAQNADESSAEGEGGQEGDEGEDEEAEAQEDDQSLLESLPVYTHSFPIHLVEKPWGLAWSAGFSILGVRDQRYRLEPIAPDDEHANLIRVSDGSFPYEISAFAHYIPLRYQWIGVSAGLASEVPVDKLTAMLGISFPVRTLPVASTGYLSLGISYAQRKRLRAEFEDSKMVSASLTPDAITEDRYGFGAFVALSFGFLGGEEQFKGVFPGDDGD